MVGVFFTPAAVARMVVWLTWMEGFLRDEHYSHQDLIKFLGHQLRLKIRANRKRFLSVDFSESWVQVARFVRVNRAKFDFPF